MVRAHMSANAYDEQLEEKKIGQEGKKVWALITASDEAYRKKAEADETLYRAMEDLNAYVEPSHVLFCSMAVPELARKLEKIYGAGMPIPNGGLGARAGVGVPGLAGGGSRGILQQLQKSGHGSWATPLHFLQENPEDAEGGAAALVEFRQELKGVITQLQDGKYRTLTDGDKARPTLFKKFVEDEGAAAEEIIQVLENLVERPEASQGAKDDITAVAEALKGSLEAFKALAEWEDPEKEATPEAKTAEGQKARREERKKIIEDLKSAFGDKKDEKKDEKKEEKKDDKGAGTGRTGPLYDPEDEMGAVLMADKLEENFKNARELLQAMMLRSQEVENARLKKASQVSVPPFNVGTITDVLPPTGGGFGTAIGGVDYRSQMQAQDFYGGRARLYELPPEDIPDSALEDLARARSALNTASRLHDKVDLPKVMVKMEALGFQPNDPGERDQWHLQRIIDIRDTIDQQDKKLCELENGMITKARQAVARAESATLGEMRGEMLRDAGKAHKSLARAREVLAKTITSQQLRSDDMMLREGLAVANLQNLARDQASRLLDESARLVQLAQEKIQDWDTLDALLLFKSAQEKISRAEVSSQDMSGNSINTHGICRTLLYIPDL